MTYLRRLEARELLPAVAIAVGVGAIGGLLSPALVQAIATQHGQLYLWLLVLAIAAAGWCFFMRRTTVKGFSARWVFLPITVIVAAESLFANGVGGVVSRRARLGSARRVVRGNRPDQSADPRLAGWLRRPGHPPATHSEVRRVSGARRRALDAGAPRDVAVATALQEDGGVMKLLKPVAIGYWVITTRSWSTSPISRSER